ncbi:MAG: tetratricopeptide repeat protein [Planctomycetes bacterium]|nr:tetratricopeptide repeat protein [Planctomycetota bacterium]
MGIFDTGRRRLEALEREVLSNPTPQNMVSLAENYARLGDWARAVEVARKAIEKFPDSEKCALTYQYVRKNQFQSEIQELNRSIRTRPQAQHYERLAHIYLTELADKNRALEIAQEGLLKFPSSDVLHCVCAQVRMERFHTDFLGNDGMEAIRHSQLALATNNENATALYCLGRLQAEAGAYDKARPVVENYQRRYPNDDNMKQLLKLIDAHMPESVGDLDDAFVEIETRHGLSPVGMEMMQIFQPVRSSAAPQISPSKMEAFLRGYDMIHGYKCSAVVAKGGELLASHSRGLVPSEKFVYLLQRIYQCAEDSSKRMDIGTFINGEIECSLGKVVVSEWKNLVLGILADRPAKREDFRRAIDKFQAFAS